MCMFATVLFSAFCLESRDMYIRRFLAISVIDCKSVFDFVTKPGAPTGIDDKRCAIDMAIIRGCLKRMGVTLRCGPTELMLGDALTKDKAEAADLLRACVRASAYQLANESFTLQRAREEREPRSLLKTNGKIRGHGRRTAGENRFWKGSRTWYRQSRQRRQHRDVCEWFSQPRPSCTTFLEAGEGKGDAAARGEHGKHPGHDGGISGGQDSANARGLGERLCEVDARGAAHGHEEPVFACNQTLSGATDRLPEHEQPSPRLTRAQ